MSLREFTDRPRLGTARGRRTCTDVARVASAEDRHMTRGRRLVAGAAIALVVLALPVPAQAVTPRTGFYAARAAGMTRLDVEFAIERGRIVRPQRSPALRVYGLKCARGREREAWTETVSLRRGVLRGSWYSGAFDRRGKWVRGEAFEISGRWTKPGLVTGRMRWRRTEGRRCSSGWVQWRAAPANPVTVTSAAAASFAIPGDLTIVATVTNDGEAASKNTTAAINVNAVISPRPNDYAQFGGVTSSQGSCDPGMTVDLDSAVLSIRCRLGTVPAHGRATLALTLRWPLEACRDPETGYPRELGEITFYSEFVSPLNEGDLSVESDENAETRRSQPLCPALPPPPPSPVDEPESG
jgi:hypothetical protein